MLNHDPIEENEGLDGRTWTLTPHRGGWLYFVTMVPMTMATVAIMVAILGVVLLGLIDLAVGLGLHYSELVPWFVVYGPAIVGLFVAVHAGLRSMVRLELRQTQHQLRVAPIDRAGGFGWWLVDTGRLQRTHPELFSGATLRVAWRDIASVRIEEADHLTASAILVVLRDGRTLRLPAMGNGQRFSNALHLQQIANELTDVAQSAPRGEAAVPESVHKLVGRSRQTEG